MNISWLESILYGFISGLSEFLPVSSSAHQHLMLYLFGADGRDPVRDLFVHIGLLLCVLTCSRTFLDMVKRERAYAGRNRGSRQYPYRAKQDADYIRTAVLPLMITMIIIRFIFKPGSSLMLTAFFTLINGVIIFLPGRMMQGNKDAGLMTPLDSTLLGAAGGLSALTGFSGFGCAYSASVARGAAKNHAFTWCLLLMIPALLFSCIFDIISMFNGPAVAFWSNLFGYLLSACAAYGGTYLSINTIRSLTSRTGLSAFAYYCWGFALLSFFIFLTVA